MSNRPGPDSAGYDAAFYAELEETALPSARVIVPMLMKWMAIDSVVDVGCGDGSWLSIFRENGVSEVLGLDGPWVRGDQLKIPGDCFARRALDQSLELGARRFDLAMTLEVAEHLPPARAAGLVAELTDAAPVVFFSAAPPDQGGANHVNEQWPAYWAELFAARGYRAIDAVRPAVWTDDRVCWWYKQNCLLFASAAAIAENPALKALVETSPESPHALIHPELFRQKVKLAEPSFGRWMKQGGRALARSFAKRRARG
ncbi:MAG: methyltransferase domain-containing protein [Marivibrio sp.]|uniref:methyltransferase domain-containing protein n=1 Tax=Marivibrio sp. TaxID=2039719 RepID=UPI0032EDD2E1